MVEAVVDCIFCRIVRGEIPATVVGENDHAVAFRDLQPQAPTHIVIVPRRHLSALREVTADDASLMAGIMTLAVAVARQEGVSDGGYRVLTNDGADAGQTVFHLHWHLLGGRPLGALG